MDIIEQCYNMSHSFGDVPLKVFIIKTLFVRPSFYCCVGNLQRDVNLNTSFSCTNIVEHKYSLGLQPLLWINNQCIIELPIQTFGSYLSTLAFLANSAFMSKEHFDLRNE